MLDARRFPLAALTECVGARPGALLYDLCRGVDRSAVAPAAPPATLSAEDSFRVCGTLHAARAHVDELAGLLEARVDGERAASGRLPTTLRVSLRVSQGERVRGLSAWPAARLLT